LSKEVVPTLLPNPHRAKSAFTLSSSCRNVSGTENGMPSLHQNPHRNEVGLHAEFAVAILAVLSEVDARAVSVELPLVPFLEYYTYDSLALAECVL
jgi:hypothetical protein